MSPNAVMERHSHAPPYGKGGDGSYRDERAKKSGGYTDAELEQVQALGFSHAAKAFVGIDEKRIPCSGHQTRLNGNKMKISGGSLSLIQMLSA